MVITVPVSFLKSGVEFSCIYAISDTLAVGACRAVIDSGKKEYRRIIVWQEQMVDIAEYYHPSITTLKYPRVEIALQSVRTLFDMINRKKVVETAKYWRNSYRAGSLRANCNACLLSSRHRKGICENI